MQEAWLSGYWDEAVSFFRGLFNSTFKTNPYIHRGLITGIKSYKEKTLADTVANAHAQIEERQYEAELIADGFAPERIRKYGFAFRRKECLIG